jgi:hypothetical protein
MDTRNFAEHIAKERNCSPELVRAIVTDSLSALHECAVKEGIGKSMVDAYFALGDLAAYHFGGLFAEAGKYETSELLETYQRLDSSMERFRTIVDRWEYEVQRARAGDQGPG